MLVQCTRKFANELNKALKSAGRPERAEYREYSEWEYKMRVNCFDDPGLDYKPERGTIAAIIVNYPGSYYASPRALTTRDLHRAFKTSDKTAAGLFQRILEEIEI